MCLDLTSNGNRLAAFRRIPVRVRWDRRQVVALRLQLFLNFLDSPVELLIFALEFLGRIVVDHDVGIDAVAFDDPAFAVLGVRRELRLEEIAAISQRKRVADSDDAAPGPFADQFAQA